MPTTPKKSILIVDDEKNLRDLLGSILVDEGYKVTLAESAEVALERLAEHEVKRLLHLAEAIAEQLGVETDAGEHAPEHHATAPEQVLDEIETRRRDAPEDLGAAG